jgi:hypothetical protein
MFLLFSLPADQERACYLQFRQFSSREPKSDSRKVGKQH